MSEKPIMSSNKIMLPNSSDYLGLWYWDEYEEDEPSLDCPVCQEHTDFGRSYFRTDIPAVGNIAVCPVCLTKFTIIDSLHAMYWYECKIQCELQQENMAKQIHDPDFRMAEWHKIWNKNYIPTDSFQVDLPYSYAIIMNGFVLAYTYYKDKTDIKKIDEIMAWLKIWNVTLDDAEIKYVGRWDEE